MADKIQCTIEGCYQRFSSVEAMEKHKTKMKNNPEDDLHDFWCEKCHEDCLDDIQYLIHQIQSPKHIVCPACGMEFKSEGGRNRHVGISHRQKQRLPCAGCGAVFDGASGYIGHIEGNKCPTIRRSDFEAHRAEQEIAREAMSQLGERMLHSAVTSEIDEGPSLLDDRRFNVDRDWQGEPIPKATEDDQPASGLEEGVSSLDIEYPPLKANVWPGLEVRKSRYEPEEDLLDMEAVPVSKPVQPIQSQSVWDKNRAARRQRKSSGNLLDDASSLNLMSSDINASKSVASWNTWAATNASQNDVPAAAKPENQDPNAPYQRINVQQAVKALDREKIQNYWDTVREAYICPGCGHPSRSVEAFHGHLLSPAHVKTNVQCPTCLKRFKSTTAFVAHAESGTVRCNLRYAEDYDAVMRTITAGLIKVEGAWRGAGNAKFKAVDMAEWSEDLA